MGGESWADVWRWTRFVLVPPQHEQDGPINYHHRWLMSLDEARFVLSAIFKRCFVFFFFFFFGFNRFNKVLCNPKLNSPPTQTKARWKYDSYVNQLLAEMKIWMKTTLALMENKYHEWRQKEKKRVEQSLLCYWHFFSVSIVCLRL